MSELKGKTALVTGSGRSLGREIALFLAKKGADIVINYNESESDAKAVGKLISEMGRNVFAIRADVSKPLEVQRMFREIRKEFTSLSILVNNAGINIDAPILRMNNDDWSQVLGVNLTGIFYCTREAIPTMIENNWGRIINISSVVGVKGVYGAANYAASKAGIIGFTKSLALEVARHKITANVVAPGYFNVGMLRRLPEKMQQDLLQQIPLGRFGSPEEMAGVIAFLASPEAAYITGQVIHVNGGYYM